MKNYFLSKIVFSLVLMGIMQRDLARFENAEKPVNKQIGLRLVISDLP